MKFRRVWSSRSSQPTESNVNSKYDKSIILWPVYLTLSAKHTILFLLYISIISSRLSIFMLFTRQRPTIPNQRATVKKRHPKQFFWSHLLFYFIHFIHQTTGKKILKNTLKRKFPSELLSPRYPKDIQCTTKETKTKWNDSVFFHRINPTWIWAE